MWNKTCISVNFNGDSFKKKKEEKAGILALWVVSGY